MTKPKRTNKDMGLRIKKLARTRNSPMMNLQKNREYLPDISRKLKITATSPV